MAELVAAIPSREGMKPPRWDYVNNLARFMNALRRRAAATNRTRLFCTWEQLIIACGYEDRGSREANMALQPSVLRYVQVFEEAGLLRRQGRHGAGGGLTLELSAPVVSDASARSSAGSSYSAPRCEARRRRESRREAAERRHRPHRRRREAPPVLDVSWGTGPPRPPFGQEVKTSFGVQGPFRDPGREHPSDAGKREGSPDVAAASRGRNGGLGGGGGPPTSLPGLEAVAAELDALVADARAAPRLGPARAKAAFWRLYGPPLPLSQARQAQLERCLARLDRHGGAGAGLDVLVQLMVGHAEARIIDRGEPAPASMAFFLAELDRTSKKWRRDADPVRRRRSAEHRERRGRHADAYEAQGRELRRRRAPGPTSEGARRQRPGRGPSA